MRKRRGLTLLLVTLACALAAPTAATALPSGFHDDVVFSGLEEPTAVRFASDGRVFVAEKAGRLLVFDSLADPSPTVFADLRTQVYDRFDKGLLGLALDPGFPAQPYVYLLYTYDHLLGESAPAPKWGQPDHSGDDCPKPSGTGVDDCPASGRLVRLTAAGGGDHAEESGGEVVEDVLVEGWCQQFSSHSIGDLEFDAAGKLWASGGEGGDANGVDYGQAGWPQRNQCGDPPVGIGGVQSPPSAEGGALRAQDARTPPDPLDPGADPTGLSGALIRIDPGSGEGLPSNPLAASADANERRLVAYGFRNPFRFAIDPAHGEVYVGNVGWNTYEEIDRVPIGAAQPFNSGWPCYEGPGPNPSYQSLGLNICNGLYAEPGATSAPFFYYRHDHPISGEDDCPSQAGSAISGMAVYGGGSFPAAYDGALFFADAVRGCVYAMLAGEDGRPDPLTAAPFLSEPGNYPGVDLEVGPDGALYYASLFSEGPLGEPFGPGAIHRVSYNPDAPRARLTADPRWGPASPAQPLEVHLDAGASTSAKGEALSYAWDLDGDGSFETPGGATRTLSLTGQQNLTVAVRVSDSGGTGVAQATLYPGDTPPVPEIAAPSEGLEWHVGQSIHFSGSAADAEDEGVPATNLFWRARLYHCPGGCHAHPLQAFPSTAAGTLVAPNHDYPSHIELTLTAVDSRGLAASRSLQLYPRRVDLALATEPPGLSLSAGVVNAATPFGLAAIEGGEVILSAPATQQLGGTTYAWRSWSDGGERVHGVEAAPGGSYTAVYTASAGPGETGGRETPRQQLSPGTSTIVRPAKPRLRLRQHPPKLTTARSARFSFGLDEAGGRFRCKLDRGPYRPCGSPRVYRRLGLGAHLLRIVAVAADGSAAGSLAFPWRIVADRRG